MVKNLPAMQETQVWSLGWEDLLEEGMATHSNIFAWRIPWTEESGGLQFIYRSDGFNLAVSGFLTAEIETVLSVVMIRNPFVVHDISVMDLSTCAV